MTKLIIREMTNENVNCLYGHQYFMAKTKLLLKILIYFHLSETVRNNMSSSTKLLSAIHRFCDLYCCYFTTIYSFECLKFLIIAVAIY